MRPTPLSAILTLTLAAAAPAMAASLKDVAPYPEAEKGYTRQVIHLPAQADESAYKLEILAGKTLKVDCNHQRLAGSLEERTLEGWGYNYYGALGDGAGVQRSVPVAWLPPSLPAPVPSALWSEASCLA